jgi:hypothetical protein
MNVVKRGDRAIFSGDKKLKRVTRHRGRKLWFFVAGWIRVW